MAAREEMTPHTRGSARLRRIQRICAGAMLMAALAPGMIVAETLEHAWQAALSANRARSAAEQNARAATLGVEAAERLRWPSLAVEAGYTQLNETPAARAVLPLSVPGGAGSTFDFPLKERAYGTLRSGVSVPLFTSGQVPAAIEAAAATARAADENLKRTELDLRLEVAAAYIGYLLGGRLVDVAASAEASLRAHQADVTRLYEQGIVARSDVLAAEVAVADAEQRAIEARAQLEIAQAIYNRWLDRPLDTAVTLEDLAPATAEEDPLELTARALEERPELRALIAQAAMLRHEADRTQAAVRPQLAAQAGYSFEENRYQVHEGLWSAGLAFRWTVFDGGIARARSNSLRAQARSLEEERLDAQSRVAVEVRQRDVERRTALKRLDVASKAIEQADENLRVTRNQYRAGTGTNTEVLDADARRQRAYVNLYSARYDAVFAHLRLKRAAGVLGQ